jgi:hypothetical protein
MLVWQRLQRMTARFASVVKRAEAGTPPRQSSPRVRPSGPRERLPGGFAWLVRLVPEAAGYGGQLQHLLSDPEVAAMLAAMPGAGRVLRPLCRMLGVEPGPALVRSGARERTPARRQPPKREGGRAAAGPVRVRRVRLPRASGRPWLRWRPAGVGS